MKHTHFIELRLLQADEGQLIIGLEGVAVNQREVASYTLTFESAGEDI
jgi:hypothetical protein